MCPRFFLIICLTSLLRKIAISSRTPQKPLFMGIASPLTSFSYLLWTGLSTSWGCLVHQQFFPEHLLQASDCANYKGAIWHKSGFRGAPGEDPCAGRRLVIHQSIERLRSGRDTKGYTGSHLSAPQGALCHQHT